MNFITWTFQSLVVPMAMTNDGKLLTINKAICGALGMTEHALVALYQRNKKHLNPLRVTDCDAKEFFQKHRVHFGLARVRGDMLIWSVRDMIRIAMWSQAPNALEFQEELIDLIEKSARLNTVPVEQFDALLARVEALEVAQAAAASAAGSTLAAHKHLRLVQ